MGDLVNLRKARKAAQKALREQEAEANRLKYGRSKAERHLADARTAKSRRNLDQHRLDPGDER